MVQRYTFPQSTQVDNAYTDSTSPADALATKGYVDAQSTAGGFIYDVVGGFTGASVATGAITLRDEIAANTPTSSFFLVTDGTTSGSGQQITDFIINLFSVSSTQLFAFAGATNITFQSTGSVGTDLTFAIFNTTSPITFTNPVVAGTVLDFQAATSFTPVRDLALSGNLAGAVANNAQGRPTLTISGSATAGVTQIVAGQNVTISPTTGTGIVTVNASGGGGGGSLVNTGSTYIADNQSIIVRVASNNPNSSTVATSLAATTDYGSINVSSSPWPPFTIPPGYSTQYLMVEAADFSWSGVGLIQTAPTNALTQIAWLRRPTTASGTVYNNVRCWYVSVGVASVYVGSSNSDAQSRNPNTTLLFPELQLTQGPDGLGANNVTILTQPYIDSEIGRLVGSVPGITQWPSTVSPPIASLSSTTIILDDEVLGPQLVGQYIWTNAQANQPNTVFVSSGQASGAVQYQLNVVGNPITAGFTTTTANIWYSASPRPLNYTFVPLPQAEVIRLAQANDVSSLNTLRQDVALTSNDNSVSITTSGQNINLRASGSGGGGLVVPPFIQEVYGNFEGTTTRVRIFNGKAYVFCPLASNPSGGSVTINGTPVAYMLSDQVIDVQGYSFHMPNSFGIKTTPTQVALTALTIAGTTATFTLAANTVQFEIGAIVSVVNATPGTLNGNYRITARNSATSLTGVAVGGQTGTLTSGGTVSINVTPYTDCTFRARGNTLLNMTFTVNDASIFLNFGFTRTPYIVSQNAITDTADPTLQDYQHPLLRWPGGGEGSQLEEGLIQPATYSGLAQVNATTVTLATYFGNVAAFSASDVLYDAEVFGTTRWYLMYEIECGALTGTISALTFGQDPLNDGSIEIDLALGAGSINTPTVPSLDQVLAVGNTSLRNIALTGTGTLSAPMVALTTATNSITLRSPATIASNYSLTYPSSTPTFGQTLITTDAAGNTGWFLSGLEFIRLVSTVNVIATGGSPVDGIVPALNDRVLLTAQTTNTQNGLYAANPSGAWVRLNTYPSQSLYATAGTANANTTYTRDETGSPEMWVRTSSTVNLSGVANESYIYSNNGVLSGDAAMVRDTVNNRVSVSAPVAASNIARLSDVQAAATGIRPVDPQGSIVNVSETNLAGTYTNNTGAGTATFTGTTTASLQIAGRGVAVGDLVLLVAQTTQLQNGFYGVSAVSTTAFTLTRVLALPRYGDLYVGTATGASNYGVQYQNITTDTITIGTTAIIFALFGVANGAMAALTLQQVTTNGNLTSNSILVGTSTDNLTLASAQISRSAPGNVRILGGTGVGDGLILGSNASTAANFLQVNSGSGTTVGPTLSVNGATGAPLNLAGGATGNINIGVNQTNYVRITPAASGTAPTIAAMGDTNLSLNLQGGGVNSVNIGTNLSNYVSIVPNSSGATAGPIIQVAGSDTNVGIRLQAKGNGTVQIAAIGQAVSLGPIVTATYTNPLFAAAGLNPGTADLTAGTQGQVLTSRGAGNTPAWVNAQSGALNVYSYALDGDQNVGNQPLSFVTTATIALGAAFGTWTNSQTFSFSQTGSYQISFSYNTTSGTPDISIVVNSVRVAGATSSGKNTMTGYGRITANNQTMIINCYSNTTFSASQSSLVITRLG